MTGAISDKAEVAPFTPPRPPRIHSSTMNAAIPILLALLPALPEQDSPKIRPRRRATDALPNVELIRHDGERVRFHDDLIEDKVVVLNFMYTTCADVCPLETAKLCEVQEILGPRVGSTVHMISITVDPARDTPDVLSAYREQYGVEAGWDFFTGDERDILTLRQSLGLFFEDAEDLQDHNISLVIGNAKTGQWLKRSPFDNPYVLATQIDSSVRDFNGLGVNTSSYSEAPLELPRLSEGQLLFRSRCSVCHRIGLGDGKDRVGPNLAGVTDRRSRDWLQRFIMEPDKMLAENDPTAIQLFHEYDRIPMPNLGIPEREANTLIDYLEVEGRRAARIEGNEELRKRVNDVAPECCQKNDVTVVSRGDESSAQGSPRSPLDPGSWNIWAAGVLAVCGLVTARGGRRKSA